MSLPPLLQAARDIVAASRMDQNAMLVGVLAWLRENGYVRGGDVERALIRAVRTEVEFQVGEKIRKGEGR